jgi:hypothetical protein
MDNLFPFVFAPALSILIARLEKVWSKSFVILTNQQLYLVSPIKRVDQVVALSIMNFVMKLKEFIQILGEELDHETNLCSVLTMMGGRVEGSRNDRPDFKRRISFFSSQDTNSMR